MSTRKIEPVSDVLRRVVRVLDIEQKLLSHAVEPAWPRAAGPRLAPHTRAARLLGGVLTIEARSAAWLNEVALLRREILERLRRELPGVTVNEIRFRLGGGFPPPVEAAPNVQASPREIEEARARFRPLGEAGAEVIARAWALRHTPRRGG